jgi:hypothetical protein
MCFLLEQIANFMVQLHNIVQNSYYIKFGFCGLKKHKNLGSLSRTKDSLHKIDND